MINHNGWKRIKDSKELVIVLESEPTIGIDRILEVFEMDTIAFANTSAISVLKKLHKKELFRRVEK